jgi:general secretion pathway protein A
MYNDYFGFKEAPFSIAPDPQFLYMSERHREALAHLIYGLKTDGGFVLLTGEVGTGKTTVCQCLLEQVPDNSEIAFVLNPKLTVVELLATICDELGISYPQDNASNKVFIDALNQFLLEAHSQGRKTVLIIDEAQNLQVDVLEQIRLLTNLETHKQKLLQVIMLGQPELKQKLEQPELRQLAQRITARYHLEPLSKNEIEAYVRHRLSVAGVDRPLFTAATNDKLYRLSGGVPRLINLLCDRALLGAYATGQHEIDPALLSAAAEEVFGSATSTKPAARTPVWQWALLTLVVLCGSVLLLQTYLDYQLAKPVAPTVKIPIARKAAVEPLVWSSEAPLDESRLLAYQALFNSWGKEYDPAQGTATSQAEIMGLNLMIKRGSLGRLRQLDRPAVLKLVDPQGQEFYATLTELDEQQATLVMAEKQQRVSVAALNKQWYGEYALLWQAPPNFTGAIKPGEQGQQVQWLEERMASLHGRGVRSGAAPVLDGSLLEEVQKFQAESGLEPDGIVGNYTLILLNSKTGGKHPSLTDGKRG